MRKRVETSWRDYYEAKAALAKADADWRKIANVYWRLWRGNQARPAATEPSDEFKRAERAYSAASASLSEARERLRLIESTLPVRRHKPFKYGTAAYEAADDAD
jgi:hypothetical protein